MERRKISNPFLFLAVVLVACSPSIAAPQTATAPQTNQLDPSPSATTAIQHTPTPAPGGDPGDQGPFPLAERGPYWTGNRSFTLVDPGRSDREIRITIHYPALKEFNADNDPITRDAVPDFSGAPYPVILTGPNSGDHLFQSHLASHGFVMVIVRPPGFHYEDPWGLIVVDGPLDFLFALDQLAGFAPDGLEGLMDTDRVGVAGYSWDGFFSLTLSGVRIDPDNFLSLCAQASSLELPISPQVVDSYCGLAAQWDQFTAYAGDLIPSGDDGLWQPLTDERILAGMPMAPDGVWLYGERGLSSVQIPTLIMTGTHDDLCSYSMETVKIFQHIGSSDRYLISFIGKNHMMVFSSDVIMRMNHFGAAFFGYYLQGREEYKDYFSENFISQFPDLAWGVVEN